MNEQIIEITSEGRCFRLDLRKKALFNDRDEPVRLTAQQLNLLTYLVKQPPYTLVNKNDLATNVWPRGTRDPIGPEGIHQAVRSLSKVLSQEGADFLQIERGQGYRIRAKINRIEEPTHAPLTSPSLDGSVEATAVKNLAGTQITPQSQLTRTVPQNPEEAMAFMLFLDQFPVGIWGASLESTADLWGHKNDPGSITISTHACIGLTSVTGSAFLPPIAGYRQYLLSRKSKSGAFGMLKDVGSAKIPDVHIQEHARHTATGLRFFLNYDGVEHPCVADGVRYLLNPNSRTVSGYWADKGEKPDEAADPVTVAYVIGALEEVYIASSNTDDPAESALPEMSAVNDAIATGLSYIHSTSLRTSEGMWHYKFSNDLSYRRVMDNLYEYTVDVLAQTARSCIRLNMYLEETTAVAQRLKRVCSTYKGGLPLSPSHNTPHLDTTATLIEALWQLQEPLQLLQSHFLDAYELARRRDVFELSAAGGWSSFLMLSRRPFGERIRIHPLRTDELLSAAKEVSLRSDAMGSIPLLPQASEAFIRGLLRRRQARQPA